MSVKGLKIKWKIKRTFLKKFHECKFLVCSLLHVGTKCFINSGSFKSFFFFSSVGQILQLFESDSHFYIPSQVTPVNMDYVFICVQNENS